MSLLTQFLKPKYKPGWLGLTTSPGEVRLAAVERPEEGKPRVVAAHLHNGPLFDGAALEAAVRNAGMDGYRATVLLEPGEYQMPIIDSPKVPKEEKAAAVRWGIKGTLDFPVEEATVDVVEIPTEQYMPGRQPSLYAVVARNEVIRRYAALQDKPGLPLQAIDIPELAQRNLAALAEEPEAGLAVLSHDHNGCLITFTFNGELYLYRRIEIPFPDESSMDAERVKQIHHRITLDLQRSLDYFDRQLHFIPLKHLLIAPLPGPSSLGDELAANLRLSVGTLDLGSLIDLSAAPLLENPVMQAKFLLSLGAALRQEEEQS